MKYCIKEKKKRNAAGEIQEKGTLFIMSYFEIFRTVSVTYVLISTITYQSIEQISQYVFKSSSDYLTNQYYISLNRTFLLMKKDFTY